MQNHQKPNLACLFLRLAIVLSSLTLTIAARAETASTLFAAGVVALQKNDLATARADFQSSLKLDPRQSQGYYNWGQVEFRSQNLGLAIGLWRKALDIDSGNRPAQEALAFAEKKLEHPQIAHETELWETLRSEVLLHVSLLSLLFLTSLFLLSAGWLGVVFFMGRKRAIRNETPLPSFPILALIFSFGLALSALLSVAKVIDLQTPRGTVVPKQLNALTTPDASGTPLFELYQGLEVIIQQSNSNWYQVTYPGGMTGWVPSHSIFVSAGRAP